MPQGPIAVAGSNLIPQGGKSAKNITANLLVKAAAGTVLSGFVQAPGSAVGTIHDSATVAAADATNQIGVMPESVGPFQVNMACNSGIVVKPGAGQTVAITYI